MSRSRIFISMFVLVVLYSTNPVWAQGRGKRFRGPSVFDKAILLTANNVCYELKITPEQRKKINEILKVNRRALLELGRSKLRENDRDMLQKKLAARRAKTFEELDAVLADGQSKRLEEILLQAKDVDGLVAESVALALKLSPEQIKKITSAISTRDAEWRKVRQKIQEDSDFGAEKRTARERLRDETRQQILAILSEAQRSEFEKLKGEAFDLDEPIHLRKRRAKR